MNAFNIFWQVFNTVGIFVVVLLIFVFAKMLKSFAKGQGRSFWRK